MTAATSRSRHPSAGHLVRRLDGEMDAATSARLARHLLRCPACHERMSELETRSREVRHYLRSPGVQEGVEAARRARARSAVRGAAARHRSTVHARRAWAVAAALAGVTVVSLSTDPLRGWVDRHLPVELVGTDAVVPAVTLPSAVVGSDGSVVSFQPTGERFELSVEAHQARGELLIQVLPIERATAQITSGESESLLILPSGLRIENGATSQASYRVTLPASVESVVLSVGNEEPRTLTIPQASGGWRQTVLLGGGDPSVR